MGRLELLALIAFTLAGCKETTIEDRGCPPEGTKLTYATFGKSFMDTNCQRCHGQTSKERQGAPGDYDFASVDDVRVHKSRIFARAAADNTTMPPGPDDPPEVEREKLAEWLSCGAP
jgi:mono/diheme cytochrome c family protein